ncbi:MAG TPA: PIG-L family deacetylase [Candidatus Limnocylindria bacterium]|nr:PIG-L family deacetylase [Candidatus Limnocylindria bacterium]
MSPTLLTVFAHPDDETFVVGGSMAAAVEAGWHVASICATRGEVGEIADPSLATPETLGAVREAELRAACGAVGVDDVRFLGHRDSGMDGTAENDDPRAFARQPDDRVVAQLLEHFRDLRPDVVVTFEPGGVYGHPDHKKISRTATAAYDGLPGARLFYAGPGRTMFRELVDGMRAAGVSTEFPLASEDFGVPDEQVTTVVDVARWLPRKRAALAAHRTQMNAWLAALPPEWLDRLLSRESFGLVRGTLTEAAKRSLID